MHRMFLTPSMMATACVIGFGFTATPRTPFVTAAMSDAEVLGVYIQVNGFDIETALLARSQAASPALRTLASQVAKDHLAVRQAAYDLAAACRVTPSVPNARNAAAIEHSRSLTALAATSGTEFDRAYLQHEITFHRSAISAVRNVLLPAATCRGLKDHLTQVLPALEQHAKETERMASELTSR